MSENTAALNPAFKNAIVRIYRGNRVIGAGFLVEGGYILTCAHVIRDALVLKAEDSAIGEAIKINFPYISLRQKLVAKVLLYRYVKDEEALDQDIAGLSILDPLPVGVHPVKLLVGYQLHSPYWVLGFPKSHPKGITSYGQLRQDLPNGLVQLEDTKVQGTAILPGFSGASVWDEVVSAVVGMVVAREREQPEAKIGFMVPAKTLIAVQRELDSCYLLALLRSHEETLAKAIKIAYRLAYPSGREIPGELPELLQVLQEAMRGDDQFEAIDRFVAILSLSELNPEAELREKLQGWVQRRVTEQWQDLLNRAKALYKEHQVVEEADILSHLLIYVQDESSEARSVSALFIQDASQYSVRTGKGSERIEAPGKAPFLEKVTLDSLPSLVQACLDEALDKLPTSLMLHLILPLAWLPEACDRWPFMKREQFSFLPSTLDRLGTRFCCVVRIAERLNPEILKLFREPWNGKWKTLLSMTNNICHSFVLGDGLAIEPDLVVQLNQPTIVGLKASVVYEDSQYPKVFGALIATGTPAAVWLRHDQFTEEICAVTDLDKLLTCKIATLPEKVKKVRLEALDCEENKHIGHHLSFLWEDPALIPPSTQKTLGMPQS
ncbi:VMAP-C domain-containing protein [Almyronema epifaneia]|uniref:Trypsin-like peptidase domain-containing protein n=1 Tax=Almyronema epifaneia S1 TaxID=2991925 RepID=A0ABW6IJI7_9CYAN